MYDYRCMFVYKTTISYLVVEPEERAVYNQAISLEPFYNSVDDRKLVLDIRSHAALVSSHCTCHADLIFLSS